MDLKKIIIPLILFIAGFSFQQFFSSCVPFYFDDHEFHTNYIQSSVGEKFTQTFSPNYGSIADSPRSIYALLFQLMFYFFSFDYCSYRIIKSAIFAIVVVLIYFLGKRLSDSKYTPILSALYFTILFPAYMHTLTYDEPYIIGEVFKLSALLIFLKDFFSAKTSIKSQIIVWLLSLLAARTYFPSSSIIGIIILFTIFTELRKMSIKGDGPSVNRPMACSLRSPSPFFEHTKNSTSINPPVKYTGGILSVKRYYLLFIFLLLIQFPIHSNFETGMFKPKITNLEKVLTNNANIVLTSPLINFGNLYYKSISEVLSFSGSWLTILILIFLGLYLLRTKIKCLFNESPLIKIKSWNIKLLVLWAIIELSVYIFLPEHATRYLSAFFIPFSLLVGKLVETGSKVINEKYKRKALVIILLLVTLSALTNVAYVYAFRAGWGSSFLGYEKVMDYMSENKSGRTGVIYYSFAVASDYIPINKTSKDYSFFKDLEYIKSGDVTDFEENKLINASQSYDNFYVIRKTTSVKREVWPPVNFSQMPSLKFVATFKGTGDTSFDKLNSWLVRTFEINYSPNKFELYHVEKQN